MGEVCDLWSSLVDQSSSSVLEAMQDWDCQGDFKQAWCNVTALEEEDEKANKLM